MYDMPVDTDELGYSFFPSDDPHDVGHPQLKVIIRPAPTGRHYDPEVITCTIAPASGGAEMLRVHHPWILADTYRVCAGHVILEDRKGKQVVAFTFGGELRIDSNQARTICCLTSPAPILEQSLMRDSLEVLLGEEVEILFAERRAAWLHDTNTLDKRLAAADPSALYRACLATLRAKFDQFPEWEEPIVEELIHFLHTTTLLRSDVPSLTDLL